EKASDRKVNTKRDERHGIGAQHRQAEAVARGCCSGVRLTPSAHRRGVTVAAGRRFASARWLAGGPPLCVSVLTRWRKGTATAQPIVWMGTEVAFFVSMAST